MSYPFANPGWPAKASLAFGQSPTTPVHKGDIHRYLEDHYRALARKGVRGYVALYLGADDGFVRKRYPISNGAMAHEIYVQARDVLSTQFGNMFQLTDLWNSNIPTLEDYGQWLTKQMFMFNSDLLAQPGDARGPNRGRNTRIQICPRTSGKAWVFAILFPMEP